MTENNIRNTANISDGNNRFIFFWRVNEKYGCFSNWYRTKFQMNGIQYFCTEQYMMSEKARVFGDTEHYMQIMQATSPGECKNLGRMVKPFDAEIWNKISYEIVKEGNRAKFLQNPELKQKLLDTGNAVLAEASSFDGIWGIRMTAAEAAAVPMDQWKGKNLLGQILMELRGEFGGVSVPAAAKQEKTVIRMIRADITKLNDVDAIVNAADTRLSGGGGVDGAIHRAAGPELKEECQKLHGCKRGEAKITGAYNLPCRYIIHTAGPIWHGGEKGETEKLEECYVNSLRLAAENGIRRIAFPSISTGVYHFPVRLAARTAIKAVQKFAEENPGRFELVEWALFDDRTLRAYEEELADSKPGESAGQL